MIYLLQIKIYTREHFVFMLTKQMYMCRCAFDSNCSLFSLATKRKPKHILTTFYIPNIKCNVLLYFLKYINL